MVGVRVELVLSDYDKAAKVYDLLFNELSPHYNSIGDHRKTEWWHSDGYLLRKDGSSNSGFRDFLKMSKDGDFFVLDVWNNVYVDE